MLRARAFCIVGVAAKHWPPLRREHMLRSQNSAHAFIVSEALRLKVLDVDLHFEEYPPERESC